MKKWFGKICVLLLAVILAFSFGACSSSNDKSADVSASEEASQSTGETADVSEGENASDKTGTTAAKAGETTATAASDKSEKKAAPANSGNQQTTEKKSSSSGSKATSKKSTTKKKTTTTKKKSTEKKNTKPKTFAMSASEIRSYALDQIAKIDGTIYTPEFTKNNAGWNTPLVVYTSDSASKIKEGIRGKTWFYNGTTRNGYNVYVENSTDYNGEKVLKVYFLYGQMGGPDEY